MRDLSDPISRQQTITALRALSDEDGYINAPHEVVTDVVRGLPPVKAEQGQTTTPERGESDKLASKMGGTWVDVTCPNCGCEIHVEPEKREDTVSRNTIIQKLNTMDRYVSEELRLCDTDKKFPKNEVFIVDDVYEEIVEDLPPVKTEHKTGKWIDGKRMKNDGTFYWFRQCDQCGYERNDCDTEKDSNFCPDCGADMREGHDAVN